MVNRIFKLQNEKHLSNNDFAEVLGISLSSLSQWRNGNRNPSLENVLKIKETWKNVNLNWLILGQGQMWEQISNSQQSEIEPDLFSIHHNSSDYTQKIVEKNEAKVTENGNIEPQLQTQTEDLSENQPVKFVEKFIEKPQEKEREKKIEKIIVFYDNQTFEEIRQNR
ncbi:MAG: helix-turn-helix domain-containing protein [Prevotellaceae bacterium]|jgi:transcriptional regulator with XRE-family HTH domain|nr:helix-turn-helix domain-containing protein [Prevotellaceae bacterium]